MPLHSGVQRTHLPGADIVHSQGAIIEAHCQHVGALSGKVHRSDTAAGWECPQGVAWVFEGPEGHQTWLLWTKVEVAIAHCQHISAHL